MYKSPNKSRLERSLVNADFNDNDMNKTLFDRQFNRDIDNLSTCSDDNIGEITGMKMNMDMNRYDKGMPMRSSVIMKKQKYEDVEYSDFDLFKNEKIYKTDSFEDNNENQYSLIAESMKKIKPNDFSSNDGFPYEEFINGINRITYWGHKTMNELTHDEYLFNGYNLYTIFGIIYIISTGQTENELKRYFNYQNKKYLNAGILMSRDNLLQIRNQFVFDNYIISNRTYELDKNLASKMSKIVFNVIINKNQIESETQRVNAIINKISGMNNALSANTLNNLEIGLVSIAKISPIWLYSVDNIIREKLGSKYIQFMQFIGKMFNYYEDSDRQVIEIPTINKQMIIGIINHKKYNTFTDANILNDVINYLEPTTLDEVIIPMIQYRFKMRLTKTLMESKLKYVFTNDELNKIFRNGGCVNDYIQYIDLIFTDESANKKSRINGHSNVKKILAINSFEFYVRNIKTNCVMIMGSFNYNNLNIYE